MSEIDEFLQLQSFEGRVDSQGSFTVDLQAQLTRLQGQFLAGDTQALLKLIQALVGWNALSIQIENCSQEFSVYASGITNNRSIENIESSLSQESDLTDSPETDLLLGLSHLLQAKPARVFFSQWNQSKMQETRGWLGGQPQRLRRPPVGFLDGIGIHIQFDDTLGAYKFDLDELRLRTCYSPCLVYHRKSLLGLDTVGKPGHIGDEFNSYNCQVEYYQVSSEHSNLIWPRPQFNCANDQSAEVGWPSYTKYHKSELRKFSGPRERSVHQQKSLDWLQSMVEWGKVALPSCSGSALIWSIGKPGFIKIYLFKRGVYIDTLTRFSDFLEASVSLAVDDCRTDISQFSSLVAKCEPNSDDPELKSVLKRVNQILSESLEVCRAQPTIVSSAGLSLKEFAAVGAVSIVSSLFFGPAAIIPAGIASGLVANVVHYWKYGAQEKQEAMALIDQWQRQLSSTA